MVSSKDWLVPQMFQLVRLRPHLLLSVIKRLILTQKIVERLLGAMALDNMHRRIQDIRTHAIYRVRSYL